MSKRPVQSEDSGNVVHFDFRDELKIQRRKRRRKELILGFGAFSIVFAGGMLALNWPLAGTGSSNGDQGGRQPAFSKESGKSASGPETRTLHPSPSLRG